MKLYFLRHAEAVDGVDDAARPLSSHGKREARKIARFLRRAGIEFDDALSSPLVRARETAEIVLKVTNDSSVLRLELVDALLNETSQPDFDVWLEDLPRAKHVLLTGHAPSLSERVRHLLGISDDDGLSLPKGGLACVETEDRRRGVLKFLITPRALGVR